mgnify:CR=1 FL=1
MLGFRKTWITTVFFRTPIVAGAVCHEGDLIVIGTGNFGSEFIQNMTDCLHNFKVGAFVMSSDIVGFAGNSFAVDQPQRSSMIFIKPVPDIVAVAVNWQGLAVKHIQNHQWNQFFQKMIGAVIIRTVLSNTGKPNACPQARTRRSQATLLAEYGDFGSYGVVSSNNPPSSSEPYTSSVEIC